MVRYGTDPSYTLLSDPVDGPLNSMFQLPLLEPTTTYYFQTSVLINSTLTVQVQEEFTTGECNLSRLSTVSNFSIIVILSSKIIVLSTWSNHSRSYSVDYCINTYSHQCSSFEMQRRGINMQVYCINQLLAFYTLVLFLCSIGQLLQNVHDCYPCCHGNLPFYCCYPLGCYGFPCWTTTE